MVFSCKIRLMKNKIIIYCFALKYFRLLDRLPKHIIPLGLGSKKFPQNWLDEKEGKNISNLNKYYGEATGIYWIWKNKMHEFTSEDWIGTCHYRKFWLDHCYENKQKTTFSSLYSKLLKPDNEIFLKSDAIQVQPIFFKNQTILEQFENVCGKNIIKECAEFLDPKIKNEFLEYLNNKKFSITFFIAKKRIFEEYCKVLFPWMEKCYDYCNSKNLLKGYNSRLPAFLMERFASFWVDKKVYKKSYLSYSRLGKLMLSNSINKIINPMKMPFTFRMYPTFHDY